MKAVILAGGYGTRIGEETHLIPKPMIEIGGQPILWHIMKLYSHYGIHDFVICLGYKGLAIKQYFVNYHLMMSDVTFDWRNQDTVYHTRHVEPWTITLVDTGEGTETGGRVRRIASYVGDEPFCLTYGDGLSNVNIRELITHHKLQGKLATVTAVQPPGRFGSLHLQDCSVKDFEEKPAGDGGWINGGYFVVEPKVFDFIGSDRTVWETDVLLQLAKLNQFSAYRHKGFWQPMDTLRDKKKLLELWNSGTAPWKVW
ncbi:glucose-1-phosphate cytidylyltransferase [Paenibacillus glycanilyticus]|uniref:Glucose-1-phosphate cytidylyltransferase n=1 Tax=Paenibacillus glycanilyticus TaxID=126569 RepID=A0ABQ6NHP0_9BACL|nr:glucose-1-phosphate cytidylyltransferase [Paenibacillus glycanilyticus]GMK44274.1 glucose-1-phosphate cytidylyltransferase [Paenibacillus glycanilyticus]